MIALPTWMYMYSCVPGAWRGQKRTLDHLELESGCCKLSCGGWELAWVLCKSDLNHRATSPASTSLLYRPCQLSGKSSIFVPLTCLSSLIYNESFKMCTDVEGTDLCPRQLSEILCKACFTLLHTLLFFLECLRQV